MAMSDALGVAVVFPGQGSQYVAMGFGEEHFYVKKDSKEVKLNTAPDAAEATKVGS
jgi:malonyl CoA-acyl carrier protein transacylase